MIFISGVVFFLCTLLSCAHAVMNVDFEPQLRRALKHGDPEEVRDIMRVYGLTTTSKNRYGCTVLHYAAEEGSKDIVESLIGQADIHSKDMEGRTPLYNAIRGDHVTIVKLLLKHGANLYTRDFLNKTPLQYAELHGSRKCTNLLRAELVKYLLKATKSGDVDGVGYALESGANPNILEGWTPLQWASYKGHVEIVKKLLEKGAQVNTVGSETTALHLAVSTGRLEIVQLLLGKYAHFEHKDGCGCTPLHYAAEYGYTEIAALLIQRHAWINAQEGAGWTPLHFASYNGHVGVVKLLLGVKCDVNSKNTLQDTPLHFAVEQGHVAVVKLLLAHDALTNRANQNGQTPSSIAQKLDGKEIVSLLHKANAKRQAGREKYELFKKKLINQVQ